MAGDEAEQTAQLVLVEPVDPGSQAHKGSQVHRRGLAHRQDPQKKKNPSVTVKRMT